MPPRRRIGVHSLFSVPGGADAAIARDFNLESGAGKIDSAPEVAHAFSLPRFSGPIRRFRRATTGSISVTFSS